jgi:hypothetical protein
MLLAEGPGLCACLQTMSVELLESLDAAFDEDFSDVPGCNHAFQ